MNEPIITKRKKWRIVEVNGENYKIVYTTNDSRFARSQLDKYKMYYPSKKFTIIQM